MPTPPASATPFCADRPARWCPVYLRGLITDGGRKSIEPLSRRVTLPPELAVKDPEQALQQFVSQSPWDEQADGSATPPSWPRRSPIRRGSS